MKINLPDFRKLSKALEESVNMVFGSELGITLEEDGIAIFFIRGCFKSGQNESVSK